MEGRRGDLARSVRPSPGVAIRRFEWLGPRVEWRALGGAERECLADIDGRRR
jgi:hypothetical protein